MNLPAAAATRKIPLSNDFTEGEFTVHEDTLCVTIDDKQPGWQHDHGMIRRYFKSNGGPRQLVANSVEVVARSLISYDQMYQDHDNLVFRMATQYYIMNYKIDGGQTIEMMRELHEDQDSHVRSRYKCAVRHDCHNPFHRMLEPRRMNQLQAYKKFIKAIESKKVLLTDPHATAAHRLGMSAHQYKACLTTYAEYVSEPL